MPPIGGTGVGRDRADQAGATRRSAGSIADAPPASPPVPFDGEA
jgi:hypothetical protein